MCCFWVKRLGISKTLTLPMKKQNEMALCLTHLSQNHYTQLEGAVKLEQLAFLELRKHTINTHLYLYLYTLFFVSGLRNVR